MAVQAILTARISHANPPSGVYLYSVVDVSCGGACDRSGLFGGVDGSHVGDIG